MTLPDSPRTTLLAAMAAHVLAHGLRTATLRPLAQAAGTSDRMLIYHFRTKDALIAEVLQTIATDLTAQLAALTKGRGPLRTADLLQALWSFAHSGPARPYLRVWLELAAISGRDGGAKVLIGNAIAQGFLDWIGLQLTNPSDAPILMTLFEGALVLQEVGQTACAARAIATLTDLLAHRDA
jgi:AcrR family transcriptional regulator